VTKEAVPYPKLGFGGLPIEGHARTNCAAPENKSTLFEPCR
jgi:hypothetical protein